MLNILITGATGNVGTEVLKSLMKLTLSSNIIAGVRDLETDSDKLKIYNTTTVKFDLKDRSTFAAALHTIDVVFLVRPPKISSVKKYFKPFIDSAVEAEIKHIVFLSVQGAEKSNLIPHHNIEKLIVDSKIAYTFLRPAYFMQNFTTTLRNDLINKQRIFLPAGKAKFTLVDVSDIGKVAAVILSDPAKYINKCFELTCNQKLTFYEMAEALTAGLGQKIKYESPDIFTFYRTKRLEKVPSKLILIMIMLHFLPRFQKEPCTSDCIGKITGQQPITFEHFICNNKKLLTNS